MDNVVSTPAHSNHQPNHQPNHQLGKGGSRAVLQPDIEKIDVIKRASTLDQKWVEASTPLRKTYYALKRQFLPYYWSYPPQWRINLRARTSAKRSPPTFACLGAPRSGTTLLSDYVMQHPCVVLPLAKEIRSAYPTHATLLGQFPKLSSVEAIRRKHGVAITGYCTPVVPNLYFPYMFSVLAKKPKFVLMLRNPIDRAFSQWRWAQLVFEQLMRDPLYKNAPTFDQAVKIEVEAARSLSTTGVATEGGYVQGSIYLPFLKQLYRFYDRDNVMILKAEDFFAEPASTAKDIYDFLGLPSYEPVALSVRNAGPKAKLAPGTREHLRDFFGPLNEELYRYIGRDFNWT